MKYKQVYLHRRAIEMVNTKCLLLYEKSDKHFTYTANPSRDLKRCAHCQLQKLYERPHFETGNIHS